MEIDILILMRISKYEMRLGYLNDKYTDKYKYTDIFTDYMKYKSICICRNVIYKSTYKTPLKC